jgi:hypothetical protein
MGDGGCSSLIDKTTKGDAVYGTSRTYSYARRSFIEKALASKNAQACHLARGVCFKIQQPNRLSSGVCPD